MWETRSATLQDIEDIAGRLREADVKEIYASTGMAPLECLKDSWRHPSLGVWVGTKDDRPEIIFGVTHSACKDIGVPWMVCTDTLKESPMTFMRQCKDWVSMFSKVFPVLTNCVHAENKLHIKWLKWCGFEFVELHDKYGYSQEPFWQFQLIQRTE